MLIIIAFSTLLLLFHFDIIFSIFFIIIITIINY